MATKERLRMTLMQYNNPSLTDAEFQKHWSEHHAPIASGWLARNGIISYTQYHTPPETRNLASGVMSNSWSTAPRTCGRPLRIPSIPSRCSLTSNSCLTMAGCRFKVGYVEVCVQDGKVVNIVDGKSALAQ